MKGDKDKSLTDILAQCRELGGEELVEKVKLAKELEEVFVELIGKAHDEFMSACEKAKVPEVLACACACNATSHSYAIAVALLGAVNKTASPDELVTAALRSFMENLDKRQDDIAAKEGGVLDKIIAAAKK